MKRSMLFLAGMAVAVCGWAQKKNFDYSFYGQVRADLFYNTRANVETVDGLFYMYPKDVSPDADGKDLNATPGGNFYVLYTRLGIDLKGPALGKARTSAKVEVDFRGSGTSFSTIRVRQAYVRLDWARASLLVGQTWHPLFGDVSPQLLNLSTGAPFQPFSRAPMVRYQQRWGAARLTAAAVWQSQYLSAGPAGKSQNYLKNSGVPEFYVGADYIKDGWTVGAGAEMLSLTPRTQSTVGERTYKVKERVTSFSGEAHAKYVGHGWMVAAKTLLASNLTHTSMLGGYGISKVDERTGEQQYVPLKHSSTWVNVVYGKRWKAGAFGGFVKNLGTNKTLASATLYGTGTDVDRLGTGGAELTYNLPHWKVGVEYMFSRACYGKPSLKDGRVGQTHGVNNHRTVVSALYMF